MKITKENIKSALSSLGLLDFELIQTKQIDDIWGLIRQAYKKKAMEFHPDKNPSPDAEEKFKHISDIFVGLTVEYEANKLANLFAVGIAEEKPMHVKPITPHTPKVQFKISHTLSDAMKNSLYAYFIARYGSIQKPKEEQGHETIRRMFNNILGVSSLSFSVIAKGDNTGYYIQSDYNEVITLIKCFLDEITDYNVDVLKQASFGYSLTLLSAQHFLKQVVNPINPDALSLQVKKLLRLDNTSKIFSDYNVQAEKYNIWIDASIDTTLLRDTLGEPVSKPQPRTEKNPTAITNPTDAITNKSTIQLAFVLDVTGSMGTMLNAAKLALKEAGIGIESNYGIAPEMNVITYHDYMDEGTGGGRTGERWAGEGRFDKEAVPTDSRDRFAVRDRFAADKKVPVISSSRFGEDLPLTRDALTADAGNSEVKPTETKLQEALNYPGKREGDHLPVFTTSVTVGNILDAVMAEGGDDEPEMLEAALAIATQLNWDKPVRTLYVATDAPPHNHYEGVTGDSYATFDKIKSAQLELKKDPALKNATAPTDWLTQVVVLARQGVKINPMICTQNSAVIYMATFMAMVTSGSAMLINNGKWNELQPIIKERTKHDLLEIEMVNKGLVRFDSKSAEQNALQPENKYYHAILKLLKQIKLSDIYSKEVPVEQVAKQLREFYTREIKAFLSVREHKVEITDLPKVCDEIRRYVIGSRMPNVGVITCENETPKPKPVETRVKLPSPFYSNVKSPSEVQMEKMIRKSIIIEKANCIKDNVVGMLRVVPKVENYIHGNDQHNSQQPLQSIQFEFNSNNKNEFDSFVKIVKESIKENFLAGGSELTRNLFVRVSPKYVETVDLNIFASNKSTSCLQQ